ncbi:MAG: DNA ligase [Candidatus Melainabacteria bacterium]|nr:DNA ligase [Candidatus Melainabacteria bacterium]
MPDIDDGESVEIQGSAKDPYILKNLGGVYSCSCPAWRTQSHPIEQRTCKHLRKYRGEAAELERLGGELPAKPAVSRRKAVAASSDGQPGEEVASNVPPILLAHSWDNSLDLTGWWMSEKLDGVRAYWDGKQFISRQGNVYMAPDWFVEDLPADIHLDGELWIARKAFQKTVSIVRRQDKSKEWEAVKFVVFDAPHVNDVFEARIAFVQQCLDEAQPRYARPHEQERCKSSEHLREELQRVEEGGGEGLMLRQPNSKYESGRSFTLLKVKTFHDAEARVLEHLPGTGKHKGRLGALSVELNDGTKFAIGTGFSDKQRESPPPVGSIVTFRFQELTDGGVPRFPSYVRLRTDIDKLPDSSKLSDIAGGAASVEVSTLDDEPANSESTALSNGDEQKVDETRTSNVVAFAPRISRKSNADVSETSGETPPKTYEVSEPRYFEFVDDASSKFWSIWRTGSDVTVKYGKIGSKGQEKVKSFNDEAEANKYYNEIVGEKTDKGYIEKAGFCGEHSDGNSAPGKDSGVNPGEQISEAEGDRSDPDILKFESARSTVPSEEDEADDEDDEDADDDDAEDDDTVDDDDENRPFEDYVNLAATYRHPPKGTVFCYCSSCRPDLVGAKVASASASGKVQTIPQKKSTATPPKNSKSAAGARSKASTGVPDFRYFEFIEGSSSKFWSIAMVGCEVTVKYGRIGTNGQEKSKSFTNKDAAKKYYDDIVDEKVDKGYEEKERDDD